MEDSSDYSQNNYFELVENDHHDVVLRDVNHPQIQTHYNSNQFPAKFLNPRVSLSPGDNPIDIVDQNKLRQYDHNFRKDLSDDIYRVSNELLELFIIQLKPNSWRLLEMIFMRLDKLYSKEIFASLKMQEALLRNQKYIEPELRTVKISAQEFAEHFGLNRNHAGKQFTVDAVELEDAKIKIPALDPNAPPKRVRVIDTTEFNVKGVGRSTVVNQFTEVDELIVYKNNKKKPTVRSCNYIKFTISESLANTMFLLAERYTRIDSKVTRYLSPKSHKLYTMMRIIMDSSKLRTGQYSKQEWEFTHTLQEWNHILDTSHNRMSLLIKSFKYHEEISSSTEIYALAFPDPTSRSGKTYERFSVKFHLLNAERNISHVKDKPSRGKLPFKGAKQKVDGSPEQLAWARATVDMLIKYKLECEIFANNSRKQYKFPKADLNRLMECLEIVGEKLEDYERDDILIDL